MLNQIKHKNIYKYDLTNYENNRSKIIVFCKEHGEFKPTASIFLQGKGCPKCAVQKSAIKRNESFNLSLLILIAGIIAPKILPK